MKNYPREMQEVRRGYQAEVYLALATVVQAITLTAVGSDIVLALKELQFPDLLWVFSTGFLSLLLCISFWYIFVRDYFFGFRVLPLSALNHFFLAAVIFSVGFLQFIAFQFLQDPRLWLTLVLLSMGIVFLNSWYISHSILKTASEDIREAVTYDPGSRVFTILLLAAVVCLVLWYLVPAIDTELFRGLTLLILGAALIQLNVSSVLNFQKHLESD
jgi:hypothetical protein